MNSLNQDKSFNISRRQCNKKIYQNLPDAITSKNFFGSTDDLKIQNRQQIQRATAKTFTCSSGKDGQMQIAVVGATGLVGSRLVCRLSSFGHVVHILTRDINRARSVLDFPSLEFFSTQEWDIGINGCDGVVNLAGEPIATRWSSSIKKEIKESRIRTTNKIVQLLNECPDKSRPKVLVNSSAIGYYGTSLDENMDENSPSGSDYLAEICKEWENAAFKAEPKTRVVVLRTGIVLAKEGGALGRMIPAFKIFAGGPLGSGQQWISWIHRDDLIELIIQSLKNKSYKGVYNATAPNPVRMGAFCSALGQAMGKPSWLPVPEIALKTLLGEGAMLVVEGQKVIPKRTCDQGFNFKYKNVQEALNSVVQS